jgi:[amino group carrier protein]-lysine/ornithine hydrolase
MEPVALLRGLLERYSPSGEEAEAVAWLVGEMRAAGFEARVDEAGNAIGAIGNGPETIMLLGHIDTVPGFIPVVPDGDVLFGRGAVDAKGPLACFVAAAARLASGQLNHRLMVVGAVGEEDDSRGAHYIKEHCRPVMTIIGEPSGWQRITLGYKGSAWFSYTVDRALAHTAANNESACEAAVEYWNRVTRWAEQRNLEVKRVFDQVSPTLREMQSNSDGFVERATLRFGVRLPPGMLVSTAHSELRAMLEAAQLELLEGVGAYRGEKNTPLVRAFLAAIRQVGGTPGFTLKTGTSDMNIVAPVWGTPILAYGPGDSSLDHTPNEHIQLSEYLRAVDVLEVALKMLVVTPAAQRC